MREVRRLRVFENRVLRRIFGSKRDEVTRWWRKQNNEELNDLYSSPIIVRVINSRERWARHVARMGTWSPTLREVHRLRVFENRVLRKIFWPKKDEVTK